MNNLKQIFKIIYLINLEHQKGRLTKLKLLGAGLTVAAIDELVKTSVLVEEVETFTGLCYYLVDLDRLG